jgi:uncharacterized protein (DUF885 family)
LPRLIHPILLPVAMPRSVSQTLALRRGRAFRTAGAPAHRITRAAVALLLTATTLRGQLPARPPATGGAPGRTSAGGQDTVAVDARVAALADRYVAAFTATFPELAELRGVTLPRHDGLSDNALAAVRTWHATEDSLAAALAAVDGRALAGRPSWVTYGFLREALAASRAVRGCRQELWPVSQMSGWQVRLGEVAARQPVGTPAARAEALARFARVPRYVDTEIANLRTGVRLGYTAPRRTVTLVVGQLDALTAMPASTSPFYSPAALDSEPTFRAAWERLLADQLAPAVRRYRDFLRDEYLPRARQDVAVRANPDGLACYRASFREYTSIDRAAEETYALGERTVARYEGEVRALGRTLYGTDVLDSIYARIRADSANHFRDRDELLAFIQDAVARGERAMPQWFDAVPRAPVVVRPVPAYRERTASSSYSAPAEDGSRPGTYHAKLYEPEAQLRSGVEVTAFHETYPGHHLQFALAQEQPAAHPITRLLRVASFSEGWARYAEALAEEMGLYSSDAARIQRRAWPAHGMVVDPGIHVFGWTRERAVSHLLATGSGSRAWAEALVDRVIAWPGQLTAYDTGGLEIFALRQEAERAIGPTFDVRRFHAAVLRNGAVTLPMLREQVTSWIAGERRAPVPPGSR